MKDRIFFKKEKKKKLPPRLPPSPSLLSPVAMRAVAVHKSKKRNMIVTDRGGR